MDLKAGETRSSETRVAVVIFPGVTPLDLVGPVEVLGRLQGVSIRYAASSLEPTGLSPQVFIHPDMTFRSDEQHDVILVPGGDGVSEAMQDEELRTFLRRQAERARFVASVCTGALVLGASGLLEGKRATTHWLWLEHLRLLGAEPIANRVVLDGNLVTSAGVSAGIDLAFELVGLLGGDDAAAAIQLAIEYDPRPATDFAALRRERPDLEQAIAASRADALAERTKIIEDLG